MFVYNNTTRLINIGAKLPLLPGENIITPEQAKFMLKFDLDAYIKGRDPWLTISDEKIEQEEVNTNAIDAAAKKLQEYVEDGHGVIMDATDGVPDDEDDSLAAMIAARVGGK